MIETSYAAGFIDGEGSIGIYRSGNTLSLTIQISNCSKDALDLFASLFGGEVRKRPSSWHEDKSPKWRPAYYWRLYGEKAANVIRHLSPYLREKKAQADLALEWQDLPRDVRMVSTIPDKLKEMKKEI